MANKQAILENVSMYTTDELVEYIKNGVVTFEELCDDTDGEFSAPARREVRKKLSGSEHEEWERVRNSNNEDDINRFIATYPNSSFKQDALQLIEKLKEGRSRTTVEDEWNAVDKNSIDSLRAFCNSYPEDAHVKEAKRQINKLRREEYIGFGIDALVQQIKDIETGRIKVVGSKHEEIYKRIEDSLKRNKISHSDLLEMISADHNVLHASVVNMLLDNGCLDYEDFDAIGINPAFIRHLVKGEKSQVFSIPKKLEKINKLSTEVYFWGIPSSGKSCALGAILSVAGSGHVAKSMSQDNDCQGYGYMTRLAALFRSSTSVGTLPESTSIYSTYEMGFDLEDQDGAVHPLTCIDLAGELVRCMYKSDAGEEMNDDEMEALDTLTNVLIDNRSRNRKIHFFVLEYGADDRKYEGLTQSVYLDGALRYIERSGIFKDDTDAIYLMISKVDKAKAGKGELQSILKNYISNTYGGFYNGLVKICRDCEINSGNVEIVPFTLGDVCFQDYCLFDDRAAASVVRELIERSKGFKNGKFRKVIDIIKR